MDTSGLINGKQLFQKRLQQIQIQRIRAIRLRMCGVVVHLKEDPSTPAATAARASSGINSGCPPLTPLAAEGCCTECVPSNTTGAMARIIGSDR